MGIRKIFIWRLTFHGIGVLVRHEITMNEECHDTETINMEAVVCRRCIKIANTFTLLYIRHGVTDIEWLLHRGEMLLWAGDGDVVAHQASRHTECCRALAWLSAEVVIEHVLAVERID